MFELRHKRAPFLLALMAACTPMTPETPDPDDDTPPEMMTPGPTAPTLMPPPPEPANTVVSAIASRPELSTLAAQVVAAGLDDDLSADGTFTVFAPTNDAFARLTARTNPSSEELTNILLYHVLGTEVRAADVPAVGTSVATLREGVSLTAQQIGNRVLIGGQSFVTVADIETDNGVVHVIDAVLWAPDENNRYPGSILDLLADYPAFATLRAAVLNEDLAGAFDGSGACTASARCTLFAPIEPAFAALGATVTELLADGVLGNGAYASDLAAVLGYHVVASEVPAATAVNLKTAQTLEGRRVRLSTSDGVLRLDNVDMTSPAAVIGANFFANNGVIHTLGAVLVPPFRTLADLASGDFSTLGAAAADPDANLVPALSGTASSGANCTAAAPCTVFAPDNAAFGRLVEALGLTDEAALLDALGGGVDDVLLQHVVAGFADSAAASSASTIDTLYDDDSLRVSTSDGRLFLNTLTEVTATDIVAANGIIHTIDSVLYATSSGARFPGSLAAAAQAYPRLASLVTNLSAASLVGVVDGTGTCDGTPSCTVFAPTNEAFSQFSLGNRTLASVLAYHVIPEELDAATVVAQGTRQTAAAPYYVGFRGTPRATVGNVDVSADIIGTDLFTSNGVIHVIDTVLYPPESSIAEVATNNPAFSTLLSAVVEAGLTTALDSDDNATTECLASAPCTVFAPNNDAFSRLFTALGVTGPEALGASLDDVLLSHVVASWADYQSTLSSPTVAALSTASLIIDGGYINVSTQISATDIVAENGIIHVIDSVLVPTSSTARFPGSIAAYLAAYPRLSSLLDALIAEELAALFDGTVDSVTNECTDAARCTVFAPTNQAFETLDAGARPVADILAYHAVGAEAASSALTDGQDLPTLQGSTVEVDIAGNVSLVDATATPKNVVAADIFTTNGVIHIIDGVLLY